MLFSHDTERASRRPLPWSTPLGSTVTRWSRSLISTTSWPASLLWGDSPDSRRARVGTCLRLGCAGSGQSRIVTRQRLCQ